MKKPYITFVEFEQAVSEDAFQVYNDLKYKFSKLNNYTTHIQHAKDTYRQKIEALETQVKILIEENREYCNTCAQALVDSQNQASPPRSSAGVARHSCSTKIADSNQLSDRKELEFEYWLSRIVSKMTVNTDYYPNKLAKMCYIENYTKGEAAKHIAPRMHQDHLEKYATAEEILDYLKEIYINPNYLEIAKHDYNKLVIKNRDDYYKFVTSFLHLAGKAQILKKDYKNNFYSKLSYKLQKIITAAYIITLTFKNFQELCSNSNCINTGNENCVTTTTFFQNTKTTPATLNLNLDKGKKKLIRKGYCFHCKRIGHLARDCKLKKQSSIEVKELEQDLENKDV
ncbi:hypothetical protein AJ80_02813 [Polytolypa hystricis UAMH7299]|uniref:CCHC-type domain-containing protein n=1 Tax=Polytolypa hystricis (strain UAMH7299) TaxID=1447883 RepID=A0A2B7YPC6_POLH7|nr:hypothetical protein AJ80_02813 [Polytolypa hystricis UAMH7299]